MPESPAQWYLRVRAAIATDGYRDSDLQRSWPWTGALTPKGLDAPADSEPPRKGAGGLDCFICEGSRTLDPEYVVWSDDLMMLGVPSQPSALPFALFLMPRRHADLCELTRAEAARQGELLAGIERAACEVLTVPRIQVARWGDGVEHLHWWLYARPTGMLQLRGTFLSHWDDLLPPRPARDARSDADLVVARLLELVGGTAVRRSPGFEGGG